MDNTFWKKLRKPFFVLAPMANVTDVAFRRIIAKYGKPDVLWTEFVSADGLISPGREILLKDLMYSEAERPIVAQLFTAHPEKMYEAAKLVAALNFDGLDINMGCPDRTIEKQGAGAALIKTPERAKEVIRAAKEGAPQLPISVKTRPGYNTRELETWVPALLEENLAALTMHARTRKEMSKVPARFEDIKRAVEIRDTMKKDTLIVGNGDVKDLEEAKRMAEETGADGIMLGRAIFGNPFLFRNKNVLGKGEGLYIPTLDEKLQAMVEHTKLFEEFFRGVKSFSVMKKHYKAYVSGFPKAKELREKLIGAKDASAVALIVAQFLKEQK